MEKTASKIWIVVIALAVIGLRGVAWTQQPGPAVDSTSHSIQMVEVENGISLEVVDYGGTRRDLVILTGLGDTAHIFDKFAPKLAANYHVYAITRRGFGASIKPEFVPANYTAARLGEDILAVFDHLHLVRPILAGHSIAGEELSYIGSTSAGRVAALVYIEAGYPYAIYDTAKGDFHLDSLGLRDQINSFLPGGVRPENTKAAMEALIEKLKLVEGQVAEARASIEDIPQPSGPLRPTPPAMAAVLNGEQRFTKINAPALFIFASPHDLGSTMKDNPKARAAIETNGQRAVERQIDAIGLEVPMAHIIRIPQANHYIFSSNEADVVREINAFVATLRSGN